MHLVDVQSSDADLPRYFDLDVVMRMAAMMCVAWRKYLKSSTFSAVQKFPPRTRQQHQSRNHPLLLSIKLNQVLSEPSKFLRFFFSKIATVTSFPIRNWLGDTKRPKRRVPFDFTVTLYKTDLSPVWLSLGTGVPPMWHSWAQALKAKKTMGTLWSLQLFAPTKAPKMGWNVAVLPSCVGFLKDVHMISYDPCVYYVKGYQKWYNSMLPDPFIVTSCLNMWLSWQKKIISQTITSNIWCII